MFGSIKSNPKNDKIFSIKNEIRNLIEKSQRINFNKEKFEKEGVELSLEFLESVERINNDLNKISALKEELKELSVVSYEDKTSFMPHETFNVIID